MSQRTDKEKLLEEPFRGPGHRPRRGPSGPGPPISSGSDDNIVGYDLKFVLELDQKYECPICLLGLREPVQTECGHRFCNLCIRKSLRDTGERCPIDNTPLTESQMFLDVCIKREIMDLLAHCPHRGCKEILELRHIEAHKSKCEFLPIPCPNLCGTFCIVSGIEEHLAKFCENRRVTCTYCEAILQYNKVEDHLRKCPKVEVNCPHCAEVFIQEQLKSHIDINCPKVETHCTFVPFGCKHTMLRELLKKHLEESIHEHMAMISHNVMQMQYLTAPFFQQHKLLSDGLSHDPSPDYRTSDNATGDIYGLKTHFHQELLTSGISAITSSMENMQMRQQEHQQQPRRGYQWQASRGGMSEQCSRPTMRDGRDSPEVLILKDRLKYQEQKTAVQEQKIFELHSKVLYGNQKLAEKDETIDLLKEKLRNIEARNCAGKFYWKLEQFHTLREEANTKGSDSVVRHSQGFYTSYYGYKLCVRVNLNCRDPNKGYVSLFIHFMKGEFDDYLEWPFQGNITLSIEDQNIDFMKRKHISELLIAKPGLAAFDKPASNRNHKGFGYMEFAPLLSLETGSYIKDHAILIKVIVCPSTTK